MTGGRCWTKEGRPKRRYETRRAAKQARQRFMREFGNDPGAPYRCSECDYFHLGHYPTSPAIRRRLREQHRSSA